MEHRGTRRRATSRHAWRRLAAGTLLAGLATAAVVGLAPGPAHAASVTQVTITGIGLNAPLEVLAETHPELCATLYREVSWLVRKKPDAEEPDPETLGPQYTLLADVDGEPRHRFHLYPLAEGGPRVFRPAEQPGDREVKDGWFHGRLGMPETLASAGVPVYDDPAAPSGVGGGVLLPEEETTDDRGMLGFLEDWREGMRLTGAVTLAIVACLAGAALLIRRKV